MRWRTFRRNEPEPQAKSSTLSSRDLLPVEGSWLSIVTMADQDAGYLLRRVELARRLARASGKLAEQIFVGVTEPVCVCRKLPQTFSNLSDDFG